MIAPHRFLEKACFAAIPIVVLSVGVAEVQASTLARYVLETTNRAGNPTSTVSIGETFSLRISVEDVREMPLGVYAGGLDLLFDGSLVSAVGPFTYGPKFQVAHSSTF